MTSSSVARLTSHLAQLSVTRAAGSGLVAGRLICANQHVPSSQSGASFLWARTFATDGKSAKKAVPPPASEEEKETESKGPQPFLQHQEWVKFQQSIRVDGFQTGQVTSASILRKSKGGKQARNRKAKDLARLQHMDPTFQAGAASSASKFPAIRYSPEETEELLKLAFDTLPEKTGKRGTRNLKRQNRRWKLVREIRAKYKRQMEAAHERRMEHRHWKREQTKAVKEMAPELCAQDMQYQARVVRRWAATMFPEEPSSSTTSRLVDDGAETNGGKLAAAKA